MESFMFCGNCGSNISDNNNFCIKCGNKIEKEDIVSIEENTSSNEMNIEDDDIVESPVVPDDKIKASFISHFIRYECQHCKSKINRGATVCIRCGRTMTKEYLKSQNKIYRIAFIVALILALGARAYVKNEFKKYTNENSTYQTSKEEEKR